MLPAWLNVAHSPGRAMFFFATRDDLLGSDPLRHSWQDGSGRAALLI